ncbi:hypothetical protein BHE74_00047258 [Ensete ventricosum]|nr:hypothetical protein BHE74_00047258 [Ensete ventricosum]
MIRPCCYYITALIKILIYGISHRSRAAALRRLLSVTLRSKSTTNLLLTAPSTEAPHMRCSPLTGATRQTARPQKTMLDRGEITDFL